MMNPALPRTHVDEDGRPLSDIEPGRITCYGCGKTIFNSRLCVMVGARLFHDEGCADRTALRRLRAIR